MTETAAPTPAPTPASSPAPSSGKRSLLGRDKSAPAPTGAPTGPARLGDLLAARGLVSHEQLRDALLAQSEGGMRLGSTLVRLGILTERSLAEALAAQAELPLIDLAHVDVDRDVAMLLPELEAKRLCALPIARNGDRIDVAVGDPYAPNILELLIEALKAPVRLMVSAEPDILQTINGLYVRTAEMDEALKLFEARTEERRRQLSEQAATTTTVDESAPVVRVVNLILEQAVRERASDIHIEPQEQQIRVRVRTDGALHETMTLPFSMGAPLLSRIKVLADMNIVERRRPQDGTFTSDVLGREIDVRVATSPTVFGEMCVMRLLDKTRAFHDLGRLGMLPDTEQRYRDLIRSPFGLVVCAGPTGSGKTTTLYATLAAVNDDAIKVTTIEDPVEYVIPTINQMQIHEAGGLTFASGLRAVLRQDPDAILVGEIRDVETARIAVQAALTGHFVMSSIHATDASSAMHRFLDMGIEPFLLASALSGVVGQRLVRRNCPRCAAPYTPGVEEVAFVERVLGSVPDTATFMKGTGCNFCRETGFFDRVGVYEVLVITDEMRELIVRSAQQSELRRVAKEQGMRSLSEQAAALALAGTTTVSEVLRSVMVA